MSAATKGVPARFDPAAARRKAMIAKVHVAKHQLGLADDDYVAVILRETGHTSSAKCNLDELEKIVRAFERQGFSAKAKAPGSGRRVPIADHPSARKARAMWISLGLLGAVDPAEAKLEAFARRQLRVDRLQWADQAQVYKLVEALKAMAERHGWRQSTEGLPSTAVSIALKRRLCEALLGKLWTSGLAPADWNIQRAAWEFAGVEIDLLFASPETLDTIARKFGAVLAEGNR